MKKPTSTMHLRGDDARQFMKCVQVGTAGVRERRLPTPEEVHELAVDKGWYDDFVPQNIHPDWLPAKLALCHAELSEALEAYRGNGLPEPGQAITPGQGSIAEELADTVIRIFDICGALGIPIVEVIADKHEYNRSRPYRHGGKVV